MYAHANFMGATFAWGCIGVVLMFAGSMASILMWDGVVPWLCVGSNSLSLDYARGATGRRSEILWSDFVRGHFVYLYIISRMDTPLPTKWVFRFWNWGCMACPLLRHQLTNHFARALPLVIQIGFCRRAQLRKARVNSCEDHAADHIVFHR